MGLNFLDYLVIIPAVVTIPLHIAIITVILLNLRDKLVRNMYFMLVISQSILDVFCMICQVFFHVAPHIQIVANFIWSMRSTSLPAWCFIHMYFFLLARSIGMVLICLQRSLSIAYPFSYVNMLVNSVPGVCVVLFHFTLSVVLPLPIFYYHKGFQLASKKLDYVMTVEMIQTISSSRLFGTVVVSLATAISIAALGHSYFYAGIKPVRGIKMKNDINILKVVTIYLISYFGLAGYVGLLFTVFYTEEYSLTDDHEYSLVSVLFSCVQPWLLLLLLPYFRYQIFFCTTPPPPPRVTTATTGRVAPMMPVKF